MSANQKQNAGLVPKLRFPEFRGAGEWEEKPLSRICRITQGGTPDTTIAAYWGGTIQWLTPAEMGKSTNKYIKETARTITEKGLVNCSSEMLPVNSVIISTRAPIGHLTINQAPMAINQGCRGLVINSGFNVHFIFFTLEKSKVQLNDLGAGNTFKELSGATLKNFCIPLSNLEAEQQKIADCLTSLDELIHLEAEKLAAIKAHKKGLMQQLFPAEGQTLPKLRFPEFQDAGEWEERELGPMTTKIGSGITPTGGDKNYKTEGRPFVRSQNIGWGELILEDVAFIDEETHQSFGSTEICANDVLLNITGASIGRSAIADSRIEGGNVNQHVCIIRTKFGYLNHTLLNQFLISERGQKQIDSFQAGGNRQGLNFAQIRSFGIPVPPTKTEQQKIADCLSALDTQITAQAEKIESLKTHKKGLMQQLFPSLGGVAGEA